MNECELVPAILELVCGGGSSISCAFWDLSAIACGPPPRPVGSSSAEKRRKMVGLYVASNVLGWGLSYPITRYIMTSIPSTYLCGGVVLVDLFFLTTSCIGYFDDLHSIIQYILQTRTVSPSQLKIIDRLEQDTQLRHVEYHRLYGVFIGAIVSLPFFILNLFNQTIST
ncbi:hypothetical protein DFA_07868 [Cavenderia fasciculata]|uniref:Transmembrane protein n=1 Tax=Cavenderia fasciculata TaxID=261658 RepID=F4Q3S1_CACFS|nr:uncharacterized protein DFA_07868 [Cavenderia fasciculata]EGG16887.1 hypothetical protein DFA_07868 [Cavenderia fasciculata]|eukprot:XP_004355361.1 hypothetical protein DFA_07868 [Cavenderia fasciculata]